MTDLAQVALDFCREVLRKEPPSEWTGSEMRPVLPFKPNDLASVLAAVRSWCDSHEGAIELSYYGYVPGEWEARVSTSASVETIVHSDPCHALLAACVEAARKLKSAA